ncbi:MAG TPA: ABC transporter permease [Verrucomicrobiae bacterium]|jgi:putative ABC transport system permease protein|nr:ABC transporter permease [Verrucomicrobiae bacterium]
MNLFTELKEGLGISWAAIRANKMRSVLTTLGIVIGIVTVTLMGAAITGLDRAFLKNISTIGADVFYVERSDWFAGSHEEWMKMQKRRPITLTQANGLNELVTMAKAIAPVADSEETVRYKKRVSSSVHVIGTTDIYAITSSVGLSDGRFMSAGESSGGRPVCVVGSELAANLFQRASAIGNRIRIGDASFEVIGVLEKQGTFLGLFSLDNQVIIPLQQFTSSFWRNPDYQIQVKVKELAQLDEAREELRSAMRKVRRLEPNAPDDFAINQQDQFVKMFHRLGGTIAAVGIFVTGLSLFVGGIGIMNIMFVSVAERTREIGIRKAIGARKRTILVQFLIEAASICLLGGLIGLAIAWPATLGIQRVFPATLSLGIVATAIGVSLLTGVLSGFFPAWRAARMNPVEALRTGD